MKKLFEFGISFILIMGFNSCANLIMRPLNKTTDEYNCYGNPDHSGTFYSPIEEKSIRQGGLKSRKINMESGIGMMEKTVRLFVLDKKDIRMVFHFVHPVDLEIRDFGFIIQGDTGKLASGEMQVDYRVSIGGMTEEHAYLFYPADKLTHLFEDKQVSIVVDDLSFNIPYKCREAFRELRDKNGTR